MKVAELLKMGEHILETLHESGISVEDYRYLSLYNDYESMKSDGEKTTYIVAVLSSKYRICERKVYKIINKLRRDCRIGAVG